MPTYDYRCNACGHEFELFQSMSDKTKRKCPECKQLKLERLIGTGAAVLFKGSGFYETDYRSEGYKKAQKAETDAGSSKKSDSDANKSESKKTETKAADPKPAAKSETKTTKPAKKNGSSA